MLQQPAGISGRFKLHHLECSEMRHMLQNEMSASPPAGLQGREGSTGSLGSAKGPPGAREGTFYPPTTRCQVGGYGKRCAAWDGGIHPGGPAPVPPTQAPRRNCIFICLSQLWLEELAIEIGKLAQAMQYHCHEAARFSEEGSSFS